MLERTVENLINQETPQHKAVSALIDLEKDNEGTSNVELKTDLKIADVCLHTRLEVLRKFRNRRPDDPPLELIKDLIEKKERKLLSLDRKSRLEIVDVARQPENMTFADSNLKDGAVKRFLAPRQR